MLDIYTDLTQQCARFGGHVEIVEVDELAALRRDVTTNEIGGRVAQFRQDFDVQPDCPGAELERAARTSVALDRLVERHRLSSLAYYYSGTGKAENEDAVSSIIKSKSMTCEEIHLNEALRQAGYEVVESDLGEYIVQLREEEFWSWGPTAPRISQ
jgi:L-arabinose isomerase